MTGKWIRVFEHQYLRIGAPVQGGVFEERHWRRLNLFLKASQYPYFQITPQGIQFRHYVGTLQVEDLTIEIVPKTDQTDTDDTVSWQRVLMDMLAECRLWRGEWTGDAPLQVKPGALLEWYCHYFLDQTEKLLRRGLHKSYDRQAGRRRALQGRLLLQRQIVETQPAFWTVRETFNYNHPYNHWLKAALEIIIHRSPNEDIRRQGRTLSGHFPTLTRIAIGNLPTLSDPIRDEAYRPVLTIARLLLQHFSPVLRHGDWPLLAILFDMNALFEEYIARQLERYLPAGARVHRQPATPFWNRRSIRPDLVLDLGAGRVVIDTKWKRIAKGQPEMEDIRQVYVYNEYFAADQAILLYPETGSFREWPAIPFALPPGKAVTHACRIMAAPVVDRSGLLNRQLGRELWERIEMKG